MSNPAFAALRYRFGEYEVDCAARCARKNGIRVKLQPIPYQTLLAFLERPGQLITREELQNRLWPQGTFVDFEQGLNVAIKKLRDALCDSADSPRFIETAPSQGYRWIAEVEIVPEVGAARRLSAERAELGRLGDADAEPLANRVATSADKPLAKRRQVQVWAVAAALLTVATAGLFAWRALRHAAPVLDGPGWVLITNFENRTGQAVLDGSLEYALERELSNSRFVGCFAGANRRRAALDETACGQQSRRHAGPGNLPARRRNTCAHSWPSGENRPELHSERRADERND